MAAASLTITEADHQRFTTALERLASEANAKLVFLLDKAGQQIAAAGDLGTVDTTALASLAAGNVAATEGVAQLVGEESFTSLFHEGKHESLHISVLCDRVILLVIFDELSSLGLVRLRVDQSSPELTRVVREMLQRCEAGKTGSATEAAPFSEITEADIDALFG